MPKPTPAAELLQEVEALCAAYVGKGAPGELWGETCARLERLAKLVKRVRAAERREMAKRRAAAA